MNGGMTRLLEVPADAQLLIRRRHHDPPALWLGVAIGSGLLHLLVLMWAMPQLLRPVSNQAESRSPDAIAPVEIVQIPTSDPASEAVPDPRPDGVSETAPEPTADLAELSDEAVALEPTTAPVRPDIPQVNDEREMPSPTLPQASPSPQALPSPISTPRADLNPDRSRVATPPAPQPRQRDPLPSPSPSPSPTPLPSPSPLGDRAESPPRPAPSPANAPSPEPSALEPEPVSPAPEAPMPLPSPSIPVAEPQETLPALPESLPPDDLAARPPTDSTVADPEEEAIAAVPVSEEVTPGQVTASVQAEPMPVTEYSRDIPDTAAQPLGQSQTFILNPLQNACTVPDPVVWQYLGQTVSMQMLVNPSGQAESIALRQSSGSPAYDDFAACLVENHWQFQPATMGGEPVASDHLIVHVTLSRE